MTQRMLKAKKMIRQQSSLLQVMELVIMSEIRIQKLRQRMILSPTKCKFGRDQTLSLLRLTLKRANKKKRILKLRLLKLGLEKNGSMTTKLSMMIQKSQLDKLTRLIKFQKKKVEVELWLPSSLSCSLVSQFFLVSLSKRWTKTTNQREIIHMEAMMSKTSIQMAWWPMITKRNEILY